MDKPQYTHAWDRADPTNQLSYLLHNLDLADDAVLNAQDWAYNLYYALQKTPHEKSINWVLNDLRECFAQLRSLRLSLGLPDPDDEPASTD